MAMTIDQFKSNIAAREAAEAQAAAEREQRIAEAVAALESECAEWCVGKRTRVQWTFLQADGTFSGTTQDLAVFASEAEAKEAAGMVLSFAESTYPEVILRAGIAKASPNGYSVRSSKELALSQLGL